MLLLRLVWTLLRLRMVVGRRMCSRLFRVGTWLGLVVIGRRILRVGPVLGVRVVVEFWR